MVAWFGCCDGTIGMGKLLLPIVLDIRQFTIQHPVALLEPIPDDTSENEQSKDSMNKKRAVARCIWHASHRICRLHEQNQTLPHAEGMCLPVPEGLTEHPFRKHRISVAGTAGRCADSTQTTVSPHLVYPWHSCQLYRGKSEAFLHC